MTSKTGYAVLERNASTKRPITVVIWVILISGILVLFEMLPLTCLVAYAEGIGSYMEEEEEPSQVATSKSKLVRSSFRIEEDVLKDLTAAAEKRGTSLSKVVSQQNVEELYYF